ncbi:MAG: DUF2336 domain-containing protein [Pseudomonadota bacterium]
MIVQNYLNWVEDAGVAERALATNALARAYLHSELPETDRNHAEAAMTVLLDDPAPSVRYALAEVLGGAEKAPRHIINALARDLPDIAMMVLCRSPLIADHELIELISSGDRVVQTAIACRQPLSPALASALADTAHEDACRALMRNEEVSLRGHTLMVLARRFGDSGTFRRELLDYPFLPVEVRQQLVQKLATGLADLVSKTGWISEFRIKRAATEACDKASVDIARQLNEDQVSRYVEHLRESGQLTAAILLRSICQGEIDFFKSALSNLSSLPERRVQFILVSGRRSAFRAAYDRTELPKDAFALFEIAVDCWREAYFNSTCDEGFLPKIVMDRIVTRYHKLGDEMSSPVTLMLNRLLTEINREAARQRVKEIRAVA